MATGRLLPLDFPTLPSMLFGGPSIRVEEFTDGDTYVVRAEAPGLDPDKDIKVSIQGSRLQIRIERIDERVDKAHSEFHYGAYTRSVQLPMSTAGTGVTAGYVAGILEVRVPMAGAVPPGREIPVTTRETKKTAK